MFELALLISITSNLKILVVLAAVCSMVTIPAGLRQAFEEEKILYVLLLCTLFISSARCTLAPFVALCADRSGLSRRSRWLAAHQVFRRAGRSPPVAPRRSLPANCDAQVSPRQ